MFTKEQIIQFNNEKAETWTNTCPKKHKLKKYDAIIKKYQSNKLVVDNGIVYMLEIGNPLETKHEGWALLEFPYCDLWQIDDDERARHNQEIHELRHALKHYTVYSDIGCLRLHADGTELTIGNVGGDGEHKVWLLDGSYKHPAPVLSVDEKCDCFMFGFKAKHLEIFEFDCGENNSIVHDELNETAQKYDVYSVTNGWKIVRIQPEN